MVLTRQEVWERLRKGTAEVDYYHHSAPIQRTLAVHGNKSLNAFEPKKQHRARMRERLIKRYEKACRDEKRRLPFSVSLDPLLKEWWIALHAQPVTDENGRRINTGKEVLVLSNAPTWKTFKRDYDKYLESGRNQVVFVPAHHGPGRRTIIQCPESELFHQKMAREYLSRQRHTVGQVHAIYCAELQRENDKRREQGKNSLIEFSLTKTKNAIKRFGAFEVMAARDGELAALKYFRDVKASYQVERPGSQIEIDEWKGDLITLLVKTGVWSHLPAAFISTLPPKLRVCVTVAIDVATRYVTGLTVTPDPSSEAVTKVLEMTMTDKSDLSRMVGAQTPWSGFVLPDLVSMDNGSPFLSEQFITGAQSIGVTVVRQPAGDPARRPFIERLFGTIGPLITQFFDGRTFRSVEEKADYKSEEYATLMMDEFARIIIFAICDIYHRSRHEGLGGNTPHNEWVEASSSFDIKYPPSRLKRVAAFGYPRKATIQKDGIVVLGVTYRDERLNALRRRIGQKPIDVLYDPTYACHVLVKAKDEKEYFAVKNSLGLDETVSFMEWLAVMKTERARIIEKTKEDLVVMRAGMCRLRETGESARILANLGARIPTAEDMARLDREVVRGWEANSEAADTMEISDHAPPTGLLLNDRQTLQPDPSDVSNNGALSPSNNTPKRSKFDDEEEV